MISGRCFGLLSLVLSFAFASYGAEGTGINATPNDSPGAMAGVHHSDPPLAIRQLINTPLRNPAICLGPDGTWYLTGTAAPFWDYNEGSEMSKSTNMVDWQALGFIWKYGARPWPKPYLEQRRPLWAPEIHYINGTFWLTYGLSGWDGTGKFSGCGLRQSTSGKAEGPYEDVQPNSRLGDEIDGSLFQDDDGTVYYVWHSCKIARMKPDMSGLAEPYHWLRCSTIDKNPHHHTRLCAKIFGTNSFDHIGFEGAFLIKVNGHYIMTATESYDGRYSCMAASATNIYGPYGPRYEAIPHGGHNAFYQDEKGQWWSTLFGSDATAPVHERACVLRIHFNSEGQIVPETIAESARTRQPRE